MRVASRVGVSVAISIVTAVGCGGSPGQAVRPQDPTAAGAMGETECHDVANAPGEPLIVDWKPEQRGDLEVAMKDGVAVVSYSCKSIKLLPDCHLDGKYGFMGMTRREEVVQLQNADELSANLPLSGATLSASLGRGSTIDIAMVMVGKKRTTWDAATAADLKGSCEGATHYVRGATVGAFAMDTGTQGNVRAAAELFGAGMKGSSTSAKSVQNKDGDVAECASASPDSDHAPAQCGAPFRLVLQPIVKQAPKPADAPPKEAAAKIDAVDDAQACPQGLVFSAGKCMALTAATTHQCKHGDSADCTAQCDKGHAGSCAELGIGYANQNDYAKAVPALQKGCNGGSSQACGALGVSYSSGLGVKADVPTAIPLLQKACAGGDPRGCRELGKNYQLGSAPLTKDDKKAFGAYRQACEGGDDAGCALVGSLYMSGTGVPQDVARGIEFERRACDGGNVGGCLDAASAYESGKSIGKNEILAKMLYQRACFQGSPEACSGFGRMGFVAGANDAKMWLDRACTFRDAIACATLKVGYGDKNRVVFVDPKVSTDLQSKCNQNDAHACGLSGLLQSASMSPQMGKPTIQRACIMGDAFACAIQKKM